MKTAALLAPEQALRIILDQIEPLGSERLALREAYGRLLSEEIFAGENLPQFDCSAMDGYAVRAQDTTGALLDSPSALRLVGEQSAGKSDATPVSPHSAVRIMTGAPLPPGADAVVMVEDTSCSDGLVYSYREVSAGVNVRRAGEDVGADSRVLSRGVRLGAAEMGLLAALGRAIVPVYRRPTVALITTGDEIVAVSERPGPGQIRDANQYSLLGQVLACGAAVTLCERVPDDPAVLRRAVTTAAARADLVITSGGVSVGDYDFVKDVLGELGEILFWQVAIKPGQPLAFGQIAGKPLFGLPGNTVSSMVTFDLFVRPALLQLAGSTALGHPLVSGQVMQFIRHAPGRREYVRATATWHQGCYLARPTGDQGPGRISSMLGANSYIIVPETCGDLSAGEMVEIMLFS